MAHSELDQWRSFRWPWWLLAAPFLVLLLLPTIISAWPPEWLARQDQKKKLIMRVESIGGWGELKRECRGLFDHTTLAQEIDWRKGQGLPPAISGLKPQSIEIGRDSDKTPTVYIKLHGMHATGGHDVPQYGLMVRCGSTPEGWKPKIVWIRRYEPEGWLAEKWPYQTRGQIADSVFEVY